MVMVTRGYIPYLSIIFGIINLNIHKLSIEFWIFNEYPLYAIIY